jgi:hypothetical protein
MPHAPTPWVGLAALVAMFVLPMLPNWLFEGPRTIKHRSRRHICADCSAPWTSDHDCTAELREVVEPLRGELRRLDRTAALERSTTSSDRSEATMFNLIRTLSIGGTLLLIQGPMVRNAGRRPTAAAPPGPWATLLRVAWLAIVLGLLLQLALLLVAVGFGTAPSPGPLLAETLKTVSWSLLICVGVALGRVAAKGQAPLEGLTGLLAAPLALTAANTVQKGVAEAVGAAGVPAGPAPLWVLAAIKAAEYGALGLALNWVGWRAWGSAVWHLAVGLLAGVVFGGLFLTVMVQSALTPLATSALLARGVNELLFPVGCALVVFIAEILRTHRDPAAAEDRPLKASSAAAGEPTPDPVPADAGSRPGTLMVGPLCQLERGHWACLSHRRNFRTRRNLDRHTRLGEHRLVWLCWAHGPEQPRQGHLGRPGGHSQATGRLALPLAKVSQPGHRRSA